MVHKTPIEWRGWLPQRYVFVAMGALAIFNAYTMRAALSVGITEMAAAANAHESDLSKDACAPLNGSADHDDTILPAIKAEFEWSEETQGLVLGGLFWGYVAFNIPCGLMADRFGGKRQLFFGLLVAALSCMAIPLAARKGGPVWVIVARIVEGAGESACYPGNNKMLAHWGPAQERSVMGAIVFSGNLLGQVVGTAASGAIIAATGDWASVFYVFGGLSTAWCVAFWLLCYDTPAEHPRCSAAERAYIEGAIKATSTTRPAHIPWRAILLSLPVWALVVGQLGHDWALFTLGSELPKYMKSVLQYRVTENGLLSALPNLATWVTAFASGWLSDWLIRTGRISVPMHRKTFTTLSCFLPGVGLLAASYAGCDRPLVVALFCVGMACMGPFYSSLKVNALDISPNFSGLVMSIVNGLGAVSGIFSPYIVGLLIPERTLHQWRDVFWVTFGVCVVSSAIYCVFGSTEVQPWNTVVEDDKPGKALEEVHPDKAEAGRLPEEPASGPRDYGATRGQ